MEHYSAGEKERASSGGPVVANLPASAGDTGLTPVWEDPTCQGAAKAVYHNYWARVPRNHAPQQEEPPQWEAHAPQIDGSPCLPQLEKACV